jgi:hypothetical protein
MSTAKFNTWQNPDGTENYKCRAWCNFDGTGTVAIRASGNVSSITDNGTGDYTVNFTNALVDADYAAVVAAGNLVGGTGAVQIPRDAAPTTTTIRFSTANNAGTGLVDAPYVNVAVFR